MEKMQGMREAAGAPRSLTHPVVREIVQDQSGSEGAGGIDAAARVADLQRTRKRRSLTSNRMTWCWRFLTFFFFDTSDQEKKSVQGHNVSAAARSTSSLIGRELRLTAAKCPRQTERPMARGAEPLTSRRRLSVTAMTHSTSWKVASSSMPTPWLGVMPLSCGSSERKPEQQHSVSQRRIDGFKPPLAWAEEA